MNLIESKIYKIFIVDDNSKNIQVLGSCLREAKYNLGFAGNGLEALNLLKETDDFDLILLDAYLKLETGNTELNQLDESKTALLKLICFDICAPLSRLMNFLNNMKDKFVLSENADIINIIKNSTTRLERFSFVASRITELRTRNKEIPADFISIAVFVDFLKEELHKKIRIGNIQINIAEDTIESIVKGDKTLMQICFSCILENVYKYSGQNSEVTIQVFSDNTRVIFDFINNEPAFIKEVNKNLNKVFTQGKVYAEQNFGLDLALIKIIMDAYKGQINIRNNDAECAVVSLTLKKF